MFAPTRRNDGKRKLIEFLPEIWQALVLLARDSGKSIEALADRTSGSIVIGIESRDDREGGLGGKRRSIQPSNIARTR